MRQEPGGIGGSVLRRLSVSTDHQGSQCTLVLRGVLDSETISILEGHLDLLGCGRCDEVTIDISMLRHLDPVGARVLLGFAHYVRGRGGRMNVVGTPAEARATLRRALTEMAG